MQHTPTPRGISGRTAQIVFFTVGLLAAVLPGRNSGAEQTVIALVPCPVQMATADGVFALDATTPIVAAGRRLG